MYRFVMIFLLSAALIFAGCSNSSDPTQKQITDVMMDTSKFTNIKWQDSAIDFGTKKMGEIVNITYICTNTGNKPLYLFNVKPGCGCTVADYTKEPIEPGNQGKVVAKFDTNKSHPGSVHKTIFVQSNTKYATFTYLAFSGTIASDSTKK